MADAIATYKQLVDGWFQENADVTVETQKNAVWSQADVWDQSRLQEQQANVWGQSALTTPEGER